MPDLHCLDLTWAELPEVFDTAYVADRDAHGSDRHGLRGCFCANVPLLPDWQDSDVATGASLTTFGHIRGKVAVSLAELAALRVPGVRVEGTVCGFSAPGEQRIQYLAWLYHGVTAVRFLHPEELRFGPRGRDPQTHHLLAWALELPGVETIDRERLAGAW